MNWKFWGFIGGLSSGIAVLISALASHYLKRILPPEAINLFEIASRYQMIHGLALLSCCFAAARSDSRYFQVAGVAFLGGIGFFCGSLYGLAFTQVPWLAYLTPLGGSCLVVGWFSLGFGIANIE